MEEALRDYLASQAGVAALVGSRIYWAERPQASDLPAIVLHKISGVRGYTTRKADGLVRVRIQIDCWSDQYADAKAVARAVTTVLSGAIFERTGVTFRGAFVDAEQDSREDKNGGGRISRTRVDVVIWHNGE